MTAAPRVLHSFVTTYGMVIAVLLALGLWAYAGLRDSHPRTGGSGPG